MNISDNYDDFQFGNSKLEQANYLYNAVIK